jgi:hypothetical protein
MLNANFWHQIQMTVNLTVKNPGVVRLQDICRHSDLRPFHAWRAHRASASLGGRGPVQPGTGADRRLHGAGADTVVQLLQLTLGNRVGVHSLVRDTAGCREVSPCQSRRRSRSCTCLSFTSPSAPCRCPPDASAGVKVDRRVSRIFGAGLVVVLLIWRF